MIDKRVPFYGSRTVERDSFERNRQKEKQLTVSGIHGKMDIGKEGKTL